MAVITGIDNRLTKFLDLVAWSEGTSTEDITKNDGYDVIVTGTDLDDNGQVVGKSHEEIFDDYSTHPFTNKEPRVIRIMPRLLSTAAGRYQILFKIWNYYKVQLRLPDFSPLSQDKIALELMHERHIDAYLLNNAIGDAIQAASNIWASLPGNNYGQGGKSLQVLLDKYSSL